MSFSMSLKYFDFLISNIYYCILGSEKFEPLSSVNGRYNFGISCSPTYIISGKLKTIKIKKLWIIEAFRYGYECKLFVACIL
jgi:hypothetical protein